MREPVFFMEAGSLVFLCPHSPCSPDKAGIKRHGAPSTQKEYAVRWRLIKVHFFWACTFLCGASEFGGVKVPGRGARHRVDDGVIVAEIVTVERGAGSSGEALFVAWRRAWGALFWRQRFMMVPLCTFYTCKRGLARAAYVLALRSFLACVANASRCASSTRS
jgi:hypothetical protein